jgi:hypothetical protein
MRAPEERFATTSKVEKAPALLDGWRNVAAAEPARALACAQDLQLALANEGFAHPSPPRLEITPYILDANLVRELTRNVRSLCSLFEQVNKLALTNVAFLRRLEITPSIEELLRREHEPRLSFEFARLDFSPQAGGPRFVDFNFDSPRGAMLGSQLQFEFLAHELTARGGLARLQPSAPPAALLADLFMAVWAERGNEAIAHPNVAIIDWRETDSRPAQDALIAELRGRGLTAERVDPREFTYRREQRALFRGETRFDLLYRSVSVPDISVRRLLLAEFIEAVADGAVTLVNSLRSRPASSPMALEILTSREFESFFTPAENEIKARLLPWTRKLTQRHTEFHGRDMDLLSFVAQKPERFVIKAANEMGGNDVTLGAFTPRETWLARLDEGVRRGDVVQEYVPAALHACAGARIRHLLLSAFAVRGEYAGCTAYCSDDPVITPQESFVAPVLETGGRSKTGCIQAGRPTRKRKPTHTQPN